MYLPTDYKELCMKYRVADMSNGPISEGFATLAEANDFMGECVVEGKRLNRESSGGQSDRGTDGVEVEDFYCIVDSETGEKV